MSRQTLTDTFVKNAVCKTGPRVDFFDALTSGLAVRVTNTGKKSWTFVYTSPRDQKRARIALGTYPATDLKTARERATEARGKVEAGVDPRDVSAAVAVPEKSIAQLVEDYLSMKVRGKLKSASAIERHFAKDVLPVVGKVLVKDFAIRHLNKIIDPIIARGSPVEAWHVFGDVRTLFNFAVARGEVPYSSIEKAEGPPGPKARERFLDVAEIEQVWRNLPTAMAQSKYVPMILRLSLATGQRLGEICGMSRGEIDTVKHVWTLPGTRTKNGRPHTVPLNSLAMEIVLEALRETNGDYLFPDKHGRPFDTRVADKALNRAMPRLGADKFRVHDLRRTVATGLQRLGIRLEVTEAILNHVSGSKSGIVGVYQRYDWAAEKREALDKWGAFLAQLIDPNKIVAIDEARQARVG